MRGMTAVVRVMTVMVSVMLMLTDWAPNVKIIIKVVICVGYQCFE